MAGGDQKNLIVKMHLTNDKKTIKFNNMTESKIQKKVVSVFIDPNLHIKAKVMAARKKKSIGEIIEDALRLLFSK
mgnify:CR=1 FL=1